MSTITAKIIVGTSHPYHGGISNDYSLYLTENSRPAWILCNSDYSLSFPEKKKLEKIVWIPTLDTMLEDGLLMLYRYVFKIGEVIEKSNMYFMDSNNRNRKELYKDIEKEQLNELHSICRDSEIGAKLMIIPFEGSTINNQLKALENYKIEMEVFSLRYKKIFIDDNREMEVSGTL